MRDAAFALIWLALLPLMFASPFIAVLMWVWVALLAPNDLLYGFMSGIPFNKVIAIPTLVLLFLNKERKDFYVDTMLVLLLLFVLSVSLTEMTGAVPADAGLDLYLKVVKSVVLAVIIMAVCNTPLRLHLLAFVVILSFGFLATKEGLISLLTGGGHKIVGSVSIGDNNSLATALLMTIPLMFYVAKHSAVQAVKWVIYVVIGLAVVTTIATFSRGGFVGLAVLGLALVTNSRNKLPSFAIIAAACVLIFFLAPDAWFHRLNTIESADSDSSFVGRLVAWKISWLIAMAHPLFGGGMHAVQQWDIWNLYRPDLYKLDFIHTPDPDMFPHAAHSIYFEALGDLGFVGLGLFLLLMLTGLWDCQKVKVMARGHASLTWAADLARMMQISLIVYAVTAAALSMAYFEFFYILVAMTSRCLRTTQQILAEQQDTAPAALRWRKRHTGPAIAAQAVAPRIRQTTRRA